MPNQIPLQDDGVTSHIEGKATMWLVLDGVIEAE